MQYEDQPDYGIRAVQEHEPLGLSPTESEFSDAVNTAGDPPYEHNETNNSRGAVNHDQSSLHSSVYSSDPAPRQALQPPEPSYVRGVSPSSTYSNLSTPSLRTPRASPGPRASVTPGHSPGPRASRLSQYDLTSAHLAPYLGDASGLLPRIQTIEMYRENAKKSKDPDVEFQLAQYMVQTALLPLKEESEELKQVRKQLLKESISILRRLSERGYADAQYLLGDILSTDALGKKPDLKASFAYFMSAAKHKHSEAAFRAALCLQEGWGTSRDAHRALKFYKSAASKNQPGALFRLGMAYFYHGLGLEDNSVNRLAGIKWLTRAVNAATETYNQAPYELAKIYEVGYKDIIFKDLPYAVKLYVRSAELNYIPAASKLGRAYEYGEIGCPQDAALSIHYYTLAALGNDPNAQLSMCAWYMVGAGPRFPRNEDEAYEWALRAAHNGLPKAQYAVGMFYERGIGCDRDIFQSTQWYQRAAANGDAKAIEHLKNRNQATDPEAKEKNCVVM